MKELLIEWRHYDKEGETCERCAATGSSLREAVAALTRELSEQDVAVTFVETRLPEEMMAQSNLVLFNGVPLEELLKGASASENPCPSCSCLTGSDTSCRTVRYQGETFEEIPPQLIRAAALSALNRDGSR